MIFLSLLSKILSIVAKVIIARKISTIAMSVYSLTLPTLSLLLNIAQLGIPTTISKLIAKKRYSTFKIMQVSVFIMLFLDLIIGITYLFFVPKIATSYLQNEFTMPTLYGMVLLLPLVSFTSLLKGYFVGINRVEMGSSCQISEEIGRLLFIVLFVDYIDKQNISFLAFFAMFSSIVGEIFQLIHLILALNIKKKKITKRIKENNNENNKIIKNILSISMMSTSTRLIGSIIYFFEPIIFTYLMLKSNVSNEELTLEYGNVNSYIFPLILLPSFFSNCISTFMLPKLSRNVEQNNYKKAKYYFLSITSISFFSGLICLTTIYLFPEFFLNILYGKIVGLNYLKRYIFFISIYFIQMPIHCALVAFDQEKLLLFESIICNLVRIICFFIFIPLYKTDGMVIAILISIYLSCTIHIVTLFRCFRTLKNKCKSIINI